jgi:hypothetical protein
MRRFRFILPAVAVLSGLIVPATLAGTSPAAAAGSPCGTMSLGSVNYTHVIWIWMENHSYSQIIGDTADAPYINNTLVSDCGLATNYTNITHLSLPNYIGATSGLSVSALSPFYGDCNPSGKCSTKAASIFSQGETWRSYEESMPAVCDRGNSGSYAVRHNPAVYFKKLKFCKPKKAVRHGPKVSYDVPYGQLSTDLAANTLPAFSFVTPNVIDDMHDGTIADGDNWLGANLPTILNSAQYQAGHVVVFVTWDEGTPESEGADCVNNPGGPGCQVATIVVSPSTVAGTQSGTLFSHYSLLRTTEDLLHLGHLGQAASAASMASAFNL